MISFLAQKALKKYISTSVWNGQHLNAGQNLQLHHPSIPFQFLFLFCLTDCICFYISLECLFLFGYVCVVFFYIYLFVLSVCILVPDLVRQARANLSQRASSTRTTLAQHYSAFLSDPYNRPIV